jgi:hypothetical protein
MPNVAWLSIVAKMARFGLEGCEDIPAVAQMSGLMA